jgi:hypothetical protein
MCAHAATASAAACRAAALAYVVFIVVLVSVSVKDAQMMSLVPFAVLHACVGALFLLASPRKAGDTKTL